MSDEVHPFEGALLMLKDLEAKKTEAFESYRAASQAVWDAQQELSEVIKPYFGQAEPFLTDIAREVTQKPQVRVYFNTNISDENVIHTDIILAAQLFESALEDYATSITKRFAEKCFELTGLDPKHFRFRVLATRIRRDKQQ